jgi:hypothetical protein
VTTVPGGSGNPEPSYGNDGAMESQHQAFHSSLEISQKTRDSHIPTAPATGCFTERKTKAKKPKCRLHKNLDTTGDSGALLSLCKNLRKFYSIRCRG